MSNKNKKRNDLALIVWHFIKKQYETKHDVNMPIALKYLILSFSNKIIGCKMLTLSEDTAFYELLASKLKYDADGKEFNIHRRKFNLLFRASDHNHSASKFHKKCDGHKETITIIKSNHGNLFGGYTSIKWRLSGGYKSDKTAFLFLIRSKSEQCPKAFDLKENDSAHSCAVYIDPYKGPSFGDGFDIKIGDKCNDLLFYMDKDQENGCYTFKQGSYDHNNELCGGSRYDAKYCYFRANDYEVFEIKEQNNKKTIH